MIQAHQSCWKTRDLLHLQMLVVERIAAADDGTPSCPAAVGQTYDSPSVEHPPPCIHI